MRVEEREEAVLVGLVVIGFLALGMLFAAQARKITRGAGHPRLRDVRNGEAERPRIRVATTP